MPLGVGDELVDGSERVVIHGRWAVRAKDLVFFHNASDHAFSLAASSAAQVAAVRQRTRDGGGA